MANPCEYIVTIDGKEVRLSKEGLIDYLSKAEGKEKSPFDQFIEDKSINLSNVKSISESIAGAGKEPPKEPETVFIPEGADDSFIKMANVVNDTFIGRKFGLEALSDITSKLQDTNLENIINKVKEKIKLDPSLVKNTRERVLTTKQGSEFDQAVLMYDLAELKGREKELQEKIINSTDPKEIQQYQDQILKTQNEMMDNALANRNIGRSASSIFRLRQLWVNKDLTIADMVEQYKAAKGVKELTPEEMAKVRDVHAQLQESKSKLEVAKKELEESRETAAKLIIENEKLKELQDIAADLKKKERAEKTTETIKKSNERIFKAKENLKKLGGNLNAGFDPRVAIEISRIAGEKVYQGVVKFDELVKNIYDDIKGILPNFTEDDVRNHLLAVKNKQGEYEPTLLSADYNNLKKKLDRSEETVRAKLKNYELAQKEVARKQFDWEQERREEMMENKPFSERVMDKILKFQRFAVLSYPSTFIKLAAVVGHGVVLKPLKFGIGKLVSKLTPKSISEKQSIWGDPKWASLGKYYSEWLKNFSLTNLKEVMSGVDNKELLYGRPMMYDEMNASGSLMEIPGRSHGYVKSFIKNPEFAFAHEQQVIFNLTKMDQITKKLSDPKITKKERKALEEEYDMYDITNEDVIERINKLSLEHGKWAILMNDNKFVDKFRQFTQNTGLLGKIAQSELPIVKIPVNFMGRSFATKYGLIRAIMGRSGKETKALGGTNFPGIAEMIYKGTSDLTENQANLLGRTLQIGTLGAAFYALGYFNKNNIKKNEDGSYEVLGQHVGKNLVHVPEYESIISGAETAHRKAEKDESFIKAYLISDAEIAANNPFVNLLKYGAIPKLGMLLGDIANPNKKDVDAVGKASDIMAKKIADMVEPGLMKQIATSYDTKEGKGFRPMGETIKRYPAGETADRFWQQFELGIPGLRKNVPTEGQSKDINKLMKEMKGAKFEKPRKEIIEKIKKINY
jgi:hypothetical protein